MRFAGGLGGFCLAEKSGLRPGKLQERRSAFETDAPAAAGSSRNRSVKEKRRMDVLVLLDFIRKKIWIFFFFVNLRSFPREFSKDSYSKIHCLRINTLNLFRKQICI